MKIGILTFHDTNNFGSCLQTYGLFRKVVDLGYNCEVVDYRCESIATREVPPKMVFTLNPKRLLIELLTNPAKRKKYSNLSNFIHTKINLGEPCNKDTISNIANEYDKFIVGSDIVWGLDITNGDTTYFLDFEPTASKKAAFSSSIGNAWTRKEQFLIKPYIEEFSYIAVREDQSADWVEQLIGKRPQVVCDPTMLLTVDEWAAFVSKKYRGEKYILAYFPTSESLKAARVLGKNYNLPVYVINPEFPIFGVKNVNPTCIEDFLSLIKYAAYTVTASYHGMLFSLYFNKQFVFYNRAHRSRMDSLAHKLNLTNRDGLMYDVLSMEPIKYSEVNSAIDEYRNHSIQCLKDLLDK